MTKRLSKAVVLSCSGAPEGALNATRSLGEAAVPVTLISEDPHPSHRYSRYVDDFVHLPGFSRDPNSLVVALLKIAARAPTRPVVFPTADPDLIRLTQERPRLEQACAVLAPDPETGRSLFDKGQFARLAQRHELPVPRTYCPASMDESRGVAEAMTFPAVIKPADPMDWRPSQVTGVPAGAKVIWVKSQDDILRVARELHARAKSFVVQEFVPGPDAAHYDLHTFIDDSGEPRGVFTGQKLRIYPVHGGSGCYVRSRACPEIVDLGLAALRRIGYRGFANINFKRHAVTGQYWMLEINPRLSQWNYFPSRCGVNLPYAAYLAATGAAAVPVGPQVLGRQYLHFRNDRRAAVKYLSSGELRPAEYLASVLKPWFTTFQFCNLRDPLPFVVELLKTAAAFLRHRCCGRDS